MRQRKPGKLGLLVVEDEGLQRDMLALALGRHPRLDVLGAAGSGEAALRLLGELRPEVVVLDAELHGGLDALATARAIVARAPETGLVLLASQGDRAHLAALSAMKQSGWAYLVRAAVPDMASLVRAIESLASGLVVLDPAGVDGLQGRRDSALDHLTPRQQEVLSLMAQGFSNGAIARALVLEEKSVQNHINGIFSQLVGARDSGLHPRVMAVLTYLREAWNTGQRPRPASDGTEAASYSSGGEGKRASSPSTRS